MEKNNYKGALQHPIDSGFSAESTSGEVIKGIDLRGKTAIVTGGNTGIGLETVKTLSNAGATVIVPARDVQKAQQNLKEFNVEIEEMDLVDPLSIDAFAHKFLASGRQLDLLINNAGIMFVPLRRDAEGNESQLATNYLAVFRLTVKLWDALKKADHARVLNVSSLGHHWSPFNFDDPNFEHHEYDTLQAYGQSKTAVNLFSLELNERARSTGIRVYSIHPGNIWGTELTREAPKEILQQFGFLDDKGDVVQAVVEKMKSVPQGAATTIWAATTSRLKDIGGVYLEDVDIAALNTDPAEFSGVKSYSFDKNSAEKLWGLSEDLTGIVFKVE